jgi:hypothetical protein
MSVLTIPAKDKVKGISLSGWLPRTERQLSEQLNRYLSSRNDWRDYTHLEKDVKKGESLIK